MGSIIDEYCDVEYWQVDPLIVRVQLKKWANGRNHLFLC